VAGRPDVDPHRSAVLDGAVSRLRTTFRKTVQRRIPETRFDERLHSWIGDALVVHERAYRAVEAGIGKRLDSCRRSAKPRVTQEVRGTIVVPVGRGDGREVVFPRRRPRRPTGASGHGDSPLALPSEHVERGEFLSEYLRGVDTEPPFNQRRVHVSKVGGVFEVVAEYQVREAWRHAVHPALDRVANHEV